MKPIVFSITLSVVLVVVLPLGATRAQQSPSSNLIVTWTANNFYPSDYPAKALPVNGTSVDLAVEMVKAGKLEDLKAVPITWYLDGDFLAQGIGLKNASFVATKSKGSAHAVRTVVSAAAGDVETTMRIPVVAREVVIETPYRNLTAPAQGEFSFRAVPYFFNITSLADLLFSWSAGGNTPTAASSNELTVNVSSPQTDGALLVNVTARAARSSAEFASDAVRLIMNPS